MVDGKPLIAPPRQHVFASYRNVLLLVVASIVVMAVLGGLLVSEHVKAVEYDYLADHETLLVQRVTFLTQRLATAEPSERNSILQKIRSYLTEMEKIYGVLSTNGNHDTLLNLPIVGEDSAPLQISVQIKNFFQIAHKVLGLTPDQISLQQPDVAALIAGPEAGLMQALEKADELRTEQMDDYFYVLYGVLGLTAFFAIMMLGIANTLMLRPAMNYVMRAQQRLNELNQLKGDFLANMSHEIRTPMNGIFGMTELLRDSELNPRQHHYVKTLQNSADHLLGLINDILDFTKIGAGHMKLDPVRFDLRKTSEEVLELLSTRAREKNLELLLHYPPGTPHIIFADPGRIRQVLFNLIGNAIKFTDKGYVMLHIDLRHEGKELDCQWWLRARIEDTGIGIPEDKVHMLFEKFMQVESGSTRARQGTGLGLAISRDLVHLMDGTISVESKPGKGTTFTWEIPISEASEPEASISHIGVLEGRRILIVDDLEPNRYLFKETLTAAGAECLLAENVGEALSLLDYEDHCGRKIDALMTDYLMPNKNGLQL
ncbi:MAG TPA: ATP-binding protein, partial [Alphaproteobacteria bacterium]|nr:ATP-binding protein [Alphaproteobacteria bacterium]